MDDVALSDSSQPPKTININGSVSRSSSESVFGGYSALFSGADTSFLYTPDSEDWNLSTIDFTVDFRVRFSAFLSNDWVGLITQSNDLNNRFWIGPQKNAAVGMRLRIVSGGTDIFVLDEEADTISLNTWYHYAVVRHGNIFTIYKDGNSIASANSSVSIPNFTAPLTIGARNAGAGDNYPLNGYMDEVRWSKGIARWTSNFTPPIQPYY